MSNWPRSEDDHMEIGDTGWVAISEGIWRNVYTGHFFDELGKEYDSEWNLIEDNDE
jgi:hypothetical protein